MTTGGIGGGAASPWPSRAKEAGGGDFCGEKDPIGIEGGVEVQACVRPRGDAKSTLCRSGGVSRSSAAGIETALP